MEWEFLSWMGAAELTLLASAPRAGRLVGEHRDPFDKMIAAQALAEGMPVTSKDAVLGRFEVRRLW